MGPLLAQGYKRPLEVEDLGELVPTERAGVLADALTGSMAAAAPGTSMYARLLRALVTFDNCNVVTAGVCKLVGDLLGFVGPLALEGIVHFATVKAGGGADTARACAFMTRRLLRVRHGGHDQR